MVRALVIDGRDGKPAVQDVQQVEPGPGQVRLAVEAGSLNGIDAALAAGYLWEVVPHTFPVVLGRDFAGTVEAVGAGTPFAVGDRVAGVDTALSLGLTGGLADSVTVDSDILVPVPPGVTSVQAAAAGLAGIAALDLSDTLAVVPEDTVLIVGATGGVGAFVTQFAAATGATVLATARPGQATDFVLGLGASHAVDYTGDLAAAVEAVAPGGVTAVVHAAGEAASAAAMLRPGGRLASVLNATAEQTGRDDITIRTVIASATPEKLTSILSAVADGELIVPVAHTFTLEQAADALAAFGGHKLGKVVVGGR
jgi:NADPH:quinone reductase-like Zn-dependent oxidoreductase